MGSMKPSSAKVESRRSATNRGGQNRAGVKYRAGGLRAAAGALACRCLGSFSGRRARCCNVGRQAAAVGDRPRSACR